MLIAQAALFMKPVYNLGVNPEPKLNPLDLLRCYSNKKSKPSFVCCKMVKHDRK